MTVFQFHLEINQRFQEVASFKRDKLFPAEIDLALNKAMFRLLEAGVATKFSTDQINLSHVSALIQKNKLSEVIIPSTTDSLYEEGLNVYSIVPPDLYWLINGRTEILSDPINCDTAPTLATTSMVEYQSVISLPQQGGSAPYYANTSVTSSISGTLYTAPTQLTAGANSTNSRYVFINNILESFYRNNNIKVYWERYRDNYYKDSFIFVSTSSLGTLQLLSGGQTFTGTNSSTSYSIYNRALIPNIASKTIELNPVKNTQDNLLYPALKQNQFYKTRKVEPIMDQTLDYFIIYREESFLITRLVYDYIRKPRTISLALNQSCELAEPTHPKIVDLAIEILRLDTKDPAYQATVQDTELRTN